jgi:hypothetical protein
MPKKKPTSLTHAIYYSVRKPKEVADYKAIKEETELYDCTSPTDYLRRLVRIGREEAQKDPSRLYMKGQ